MINKSFIDPFSNDQFSLLKGLDLQELIRQIESYYLEYRDTLNLADYLSLGYEIEFENYDRNKVKEFLTKSNLDNWKCIEDGSLQKGGEVISSILHDTKEDWLNLKKVCEYLNSKNAVTNDRTGGHIHVGVQAIGNDIYSWRNLFLLYTAYENIIFRFFYADKISPRSGIQHYAKPIGDFLYSKINEIKNASETNELHDILGNDRYRAMNFNNVPYYANLNEEGYKRTLEFRGFNGSTNAVVLQNNALFLGNLVSTSRIGNYDKEFVKYRLEHGRISSEHNFKLYSEIFIKNALEFVDLIFTNNLDKVYFLRQYFKGFQNSYGLTSAVESIKFVK